MASTIPNTGTCTVCLAQIQNTRNNPIINESTPLLYRPQSPGNPKLPVLFFGLLMFILFFGCAIGFYLIAVETREIEAQNVIMFSSRHNWKAIHTKNFTDLAAPSRNIFLLFTNSSSCFDHHNCSAIMRSLQKEHIEQNHSDILYNFVIGGDNRIYEGRGWKYAPKFSEFMDNSTISIAFLGFPRVPTAEQVEQLMLLLSISIANHKLIHCFSIHTKPEETAYFQNVFDQIREDFISPRCM